MGKRPFPDPEQAPPQTAQKKPDDSGRTCSYQQNETIIRIKYSRSKRFEPSSYPFPSIRQELLPRGLPTSRKSLEGERRGGRGEGTFLQKGSLSPPPIKLLTYPSRRGRPCATRRRLRRSLPRAVRPSRRSCGSSLRRCRGRGPCRRRPPAWAARRGRRP